MTDPVNASLRFNRRQLLNKPELKDREFWIIRSDDGYYWRRHAEGTTTNRIEAGVFNWRYCVDNMSSAEIAEMIPTAPSGLQPIRTIKVLERISYAQFLLGFWSKEIESSRPCVLESTSEEGDYWEAPNTGTTRSIDHAHVYTAFQAFDHCDKHGFTPWVNLIAHPTNSNPAAPECRPKDRVLLHWRQAQQNNERIGNKKCRWVDSRRMEWAKKPLGSGTTLNMDEAQEFFVYTLLRDYNGAAILFDLIDQDEAKAVSELPWRKCVIEEALPRALIDGLRMAPTNTVYHGLILAKLGKLPPEGITDYEKLKDWVEFNCEPRAKVSERERTAPPQPPTGMAAVPRLELAMSFEQTWEGRRRFTSRAQGRGNYRLHPETIRNIIINDAPGSVADLMGYIQEYIQDEGDAWDANPDMQEIPDSIEMGDIQSSETSDDEWDFSLDRDQRERQLADYLRQHFPREQLEQLGIAP